MTAEDERAELTRFVTVAYNAVAKMQGNPPFEMPARVSLAGLRMAAGDVVEMTAGLIHPERSEVDRQLADAGAPSIATMRMRRSRELKEILSRGRIASDAEFHVVRGFAEIVDSAEEAASLWTMIERYERG